jgi:hypothetical protein
VIAVKDNLGHLRAGAEHTGDGGRPGAQCALADLVREVAGREQVCRDDDRPAVVWQRRHGLRGARSGRGREGGHDRPPAALSRPAVRHGRDGGVGRGVGRAGRGEHHAGRGARRCVVDGDTSFPEPALKRGDEQRMRAERARGADVEPGVRGPRLREPCRDVGLAVVGGGEQQRHGDARVPGVRVSAGRKRTEHLGQRRCAVVEKRFPHVDARRPGPDGVQQVVHRGRGAGVLRPVRDRDERRPGPPLRRPGRHRRVAQTWRPHSVLPVPAQRPDRGSAPVSTRSVQVRQPIDG